VKGIPLTPQQRQEIIDLRREPHSHTYKEIAQITGRPYNTVAGICRDAGLQKEQDKVILIVCDPRGIFEPGPTQFNQADLSYMLALANLPDGFAFTIGSHLIDTQHGIYIRADNHYCLPNRSGKLKWYKAEGAR
jgi:hypothetical protein